MSNNPNFIFLQQFIKEQTAIVIDLGKEYLIEARLGPVAKELGFPSIDALLEEVRTKQNDKLKTRVIDAITTNETFFFRDVYPFDFLKNQAVLDVIEKKKSERKLNIWCAAASSGQEPYTIAMILNDYAAKLEGWTINFIASDLSETMLEKAKLGMYNQLEINRGLPMSYLVRYFEKSGSSWQIKQEIRNMIKFQKINLKHAWQLARMDIIFMRNVLIYFDLDTKKDIFKRLEFVLNPDGYLFLGGSETLLGISDNFERLKVEKTPCYQLKKKH